MTDCTQERNTYEQLDLAAQEAAAEVNGLKEEVAHKEQELAVIEATYIAKQSQVNDARQQLNLAEENRDTALAAAAQSYIDWAQCESETGETPPASITIRQRTTLETNR